MDALAPRPCARAGVLVATLVATGLLLAGCGEDEGRVQQETSKGATTPARPTETAPARTVPERDGTGTTPPDGAMPPPPREDGPGGAGDEEPVSSQAVLTGRNGRIGPRRVEVPPFIAIRVELRSADGRPYALRLGKRVIRANANARSASTSFEGLRPGRRLVGSGRSGSVVIEASAEPGP